MPLTLPSKLELSTIRELIDFQRLRVLEVGAGDGRLSVPFAAEAEQWIAIDPDGDEVRLAARDLNRAARISLGDARQLSFPDESFDLVFFTWSLC
ncbi:MAG: class I SAM-dependent methyltransferase [Anaerolineales bacterium]